MVDQAPNDTPLAEADAPAAHQRARDESAVRSGCLRVQKRPGKRRFIKAAWALGTLFSVVLLAAAALFLRLSQGPVAIDALAPRIALEIGSRFGPGYDFSLGSASLEYGADGATLAVADVSLKNDAGRAIVTAPRAEVSLALLPLLNGSLKPTRFDLIDITLRLALMPDGAIALSAGEEPLVFGRPRGGDVSGNPETPAQPTETPTSMQVFSGALHTIIDYATEPGSAIGSLERLGVSRGRLVFERPGKSQVTTFDGLEITFAKHAGDALLTVAANGPNGRWRVQARAVGMTGGERSLEVELTDISFDEIALALGLSEPSVSFDMPVSAKARFTLGANGEVVSANGGFAVGAGKISVDPAKHDNFVIDESVGKVSWNGPARRIEIENLQISSGETRFNLSGLAVPPANETDPWDIKLVAAPGAMLGPDKPGDPKLIFDRVELAARVLLGESRIIVDQLEATGPLVNVKADADFVGAASARRLKINLATGRMPSATILRLWPKFTVPTVREYLMEHLRSGMLEKGNLLLDFDAGAFDSLGTNIPIADERLRIDFTVSNATLAYLPGVPPLSSIDATGRVTGRVVTLNASRGYVDLSAGRRLTLADGVFVIPDTNRKPSPASLNARVSGSIEAVSDLLGREGLKNFGGMNVDTSAMKGQLDGKLTIDLKLAKGGKGSDTGVKIAAAINGFSIDKLIGKEKFDQGVLNLAVDPTGLKASGQGRLFGGPATIEIKKPATGAPDAVVQFVLDDAARARMGFGFGAGLSGPINARLTAPFGKADAPAQVELDLTRTAIDGLLPGLSKLAGKPAKASFKIDPSEGSVSVEQFSFDAPGGPSARGSIELDANGGFRSARLSSLKLSPGDDIKVDADQTKDGLKLVVRGSAVDARPFLRGLMRAESGAATKEAASAKDVDLDLKTALVTGYNKQSLSAVELRLLRRGNAIRSFQLQARSGRSVVTGGTPRGREGSGALVINSADGGAFMSFLDLYKRMEGGKMALNARMADGGLDGTIHITDFILRDEPALRRLVTESVPTRDDAAAKRIDTSAAAFQRLSASFVRRNGQFVVRDGVLLGQQIGLKLDGTLDTVRDQVNMTGVFVPAYGLNNLFSQIPLFGPILGGGKNEGLFAVNFRIVGPASAPVLTINPLSAIAPGFLRKIFGAIDGTGTLPAGAPEPAPPSESMPMSIAPGAR